MTQPPAASPSGPDGQSGTPGPQSTPSAGQPGYHDGKRGPDGSQRGPDGGRTPSVPPPTGVAPSGPGWHDPAPAPPELREPQRASGEQPLGEPPADVRRATLLYTMVGALLVFIGVLSFTQVGEGARQAKDLIDEMSPEIAEQVTLDMVRTILIITAVFTLAVAIGHGLTAHGLRERKSWARPVGFTFSGILLALAVLPLLGGAFSLQSVFFAIFGLWGILLLARPTVKQYLQQWPGARQPPGPGRS